MRISKKILSMVLMVVCIISFAGCHKEIVSNYSEQVIYFFDMSKNELVEEQLPLEFAQLHSNEEQVDYIITRLQENKSTLLTITQMGPEMPIDKEKTSININDNVVMIHFTEDYYTLTAQEKIGMRSSIVYSLTQLPYINSVDFYVEQAPLTLATGKKVEAIKAEDINKNDLNPNPATKAVILNVYFANDEGKLVKEVHRFVASNSSKEEKLVIDELIQGPKNKELKATVPSDLQVNRIDILNGVCQLDLSFDVKSKFFETDEDKELMIYSIVNSLTELSQVQKVVISIDGNNEIEVTDEINLISSFERSEEYISQEESTT